MPFPPSFFHTLSLFTDTETIQFTTRCFSLARRNGSQHGEPSLVLSRLQRQRAFTVKYKFWLFFWFCFVPAFIHTCTSHTDSTILKHKLHSVLLSTNKSPSPLTSHDFTLYLSNIQFFVFFFPNWMMNVTNPRMRKSP